MVEKIEEIFMHFYEFSFSFFFFKGCQSKKICTKSWLLFSCQMPFMHFYGQILVYKVIFKKYKSCKKNTIPQDLCQNGYFLAFLVLTLQKNRH